MLTQERLKEVLEYDANTGVFRWRERGIDAGYLNEKGYVRMFVDGKQYRAHRLVILYTDGYMPEGEVDHINRIRSDNRRKNLREVSRQCQIRNCNTRNDNKSGIKGICWAKRDGRWMAYVTVAGKHKRLGYFDDMLEAACHRYAAEQCLGYMDCDINSSAKKFIFGA